jgi:hypothetical protein
MRLVEDPDPRSRVQRLPFGLPHRKVLSRWAAPAACALGLLVFALLSRAPWLGLAVGLVTVGSSAVLGARLVRHLIPEERSLLNQLVFGAVVAQTLGRMLIMLVGLVVRFDLLAYGVLGATVAASIAVARGPDRQALTVSEASVSRHILWLASGLFVAMGLAFSGVGVPTPAGFAFPSYFNDDFLHHVTVASELTRSVPPANPYLAGAPMHYYWFSHLWPAVVAASAHVTAVQAMTSTAPFVALVFLAAVMMTVSHPDTRARSLAVAVALFASSLVGVPASAALVLPALPGHAWERVFGGLPVTGARSFSFISHSWFRDALYESHALTALSMAMAVLYLGRSASGRTRGATALVRGVILGMMFMTDAVIALIVTAFCGLESLLRMWRSPETRRSTVILGVALAASVLLTIAVGAVPVQGGLLTIGLHRMGRIAPFYLAIDAGPLVLLAVVGFFVSRSGAARREYSAWLGLAAVCLFTMFVVLVPTELNMILRKSLKVLQIPMVVLAAPACAYLLQTRARRALLGVVCLVGALTMATDIRHYLHPVAPYVSYITTSEMETMNWLRRCTGRDVVVQDLAAVQPSDQYKDSFYSVIVAIGERRTLWGDDYHPFLFRAEERWRDERRRAVESIGIAPTPSALQTALSQLPMDVLYVDRTSRGPVDAVAALAGAGFLRALYCSGDVCLYTLDNHRVSSPCQK